MTAKIVIASAKRLIDMRHFWRKSSRMAEMSVPAWPMPIHQTKLMMSKPQPTGMLMPHSPTPFTRTAVRANRNICTTAKASRKPISQPGRNPGVRIAELIFDVIEPNEWPGSTTSETGVRAVPAAGVAACESIGE